MPGKPFVVLLLFSIFLQGNSALPVQAPQKPAAKAPPAPCPQDAAIRKLGLVPVSSLRGNVRTELRYSTDQNFVGFDVYGCLSEAYLQPPVAAMLEKAAVALSRIRPGFGLLVLDAARPVWAQKILWDRIPGPPARKRVYVANPDRGSIHNYGAAVDLTLTDSLGHELDMGTPYDFFGLLAQPRCEARFFREGKLSKAQIQNRKLLRRVMTGAGFSPITSEWWHFNSMSLARAKRTFPIVP